MGFIPRPQNIVSAHEAEQQSHLLGRYLPKIFFHQRSGYWQCRAWRFLEFFTVNIRNKNTRAAYGQAAGAFLRWCEDRGITRIEDVQPVHVAGYIEQLQATRKAPTVKYARARRNKALRSTVPGRGCFGGRRRFCAQPSHCSLNKRPGTEWGYGACLTALIAAKERLGGGSARRDKALHPDRRDRMCAVGKGRANWQSKDTIRHWRDVKPYFSSGAR
jgi:hypothetical protein